MEVTAQKLAKRYAAMENEELLALAHKRETLTEVANGALLHEISRRGLVLPASATLPPQPEFDAEHWVTVERFRDLSAAIVARSALEAADITCYLRDENTVRMDWQISNFIGGMRLQVRAQDAEEALSVLAGLALDDSSEADPADAMDVEHCPKCSSVMIHRQPRFGLLSLASVFALGIPAPQGRRQWTCDACGHRWHDA